MKHLTAAQVRSDPNTAARFSASAQATGGIDHLLRTRHAICCLLNAPEGTIWPHNDPESGECRLKSMLLHYSKAL